MRILGGYSRRFPGDDREKKAGGDVRVMMWQCVLLCGEGRRCLRRKGPGRFWSGQRWENSGIRGSQGVGVGALAGAGGSELRLCGQAPYGLAQTPPGAPRAHLPTP